MCGKSLQIYFYFQTFLCTGRPMKSRTLTLYRAASDPTYFERGGKILLPHQFSPHGASNGRLLIQPKSFDVWGTTKKIIFDRGPKLGPWAPCQNCYKMSNMTRYRIFKEISGVLQKAPLLGHFLTNRPQFFCKCKLRTVFRWNWVIFRQVGWY